MTIAIGILFWILVLVVIIYAIAYWRPQPWPVPAILQFVCIILLGIATFGALHLVR